MFRLAKLLKSSGLEIQVLDGRQDKDEAAIVSRAGQQGQLTVATNVAGRGTDIGLGEGVEALGGFMWLLPSLKHLCASIVNWLVEPLVMAIRGPTRCLLLPRTS